MRGDELIVEIHTRGSTTVQTVMMIAMLDQATREKAVMYRHTHGP